jgi:hypothetical protein
MNSPAELFHDAYRHLGVEHYGRIRERDDIPWELVPTKDQEFLKEVMIQAMEPYVRQILDERDQALRKVAGRNAHIEAYREALDYVANLRPSKSQTHNAFLRARAKVREALKR